MPLYAATFLGFCGKGTTELSIHATDETMCFNQWEAQSVESATKLQSTQKLFCHHHQGLHPRPSTRPPCSIKSAFWATLHGAGPQKATLAVPYASNSSIDTVGNIQSKVLPSMGKVSESGSKHHWKSMLISCICHSILAIVTM